MKKRWIAGLLSVCMLLGLAACGKKEETVAETQTTAAETETETETEAALEEGKMYSYLTGEVIDTAIGTQRPFAIMINNIEDAIPQSGISQADIVYECLAEYGITRMMCEFQNIDNLNKVGSIRSARHYYMDLAQDQEAIFTHFGQSIFAEARIDDGYQTISGLSGYSGDVFYRSDDRESPHNVYTSKDGLLAGVAATGMTRDYPAGYTGSLKFNHEDIVPETGDTADIVRLPFDYNSPWFEYHAEDKLYYRFQYGGPHIDVENNEQLKFKNLIIQYAERFVISEQDHQDYTLIGSGTGLYITDGKVNTIKWERATAADRTTYYYEDGTPVSLNAGKSFIAVVPSELSATCEAK
ncbi:MAG: DUF3048 domain-containing protein [Lachnospiraceae bacterium]|nr:DUF3048 domain-containing protein [Lachnospiraceae bacterium]